MQALRITIIICVLFMSHVSTGLSQDGVLKEGVEGGPVYNHGEVAWTARDRAIVFTPIATSLVTIFVIWLNFVGNRKAAVLAANRAEIDEIQRRLDHFYAPFSQLTGENKLLRDDLASRQEEGETFRLLIKLFDKGWKATLPSGDKALVSEICANAKVLKDFIAVNAGMVDQELLPYLSRASAHYRVLFLAFDEKLGDNPGIFGRYVYPKQLDAVLDSEIKRLKLRQDELRNRPFDQHKPLQRVQIENCHKLEDWPLVKREPTTA